METGDSRAISVDINFVLKVGTDKLNAYATTLRRAEVCEGVLFLGNKFAVKFAGLFIEHLNFVGSDGINAFIFFRDVHQIRDGKSTAVLHIEQVIADCNHAALVEVGNFLCVEGVDLNDVGILNVETFVDKDEHFAATLRLFPRISNDRHRFNRASDGVFKVLARVDVRSVLCRRFFSGSFFSKSRRRQNHHQQRRQEKNFTQTVSPRLNVVPIF